MSRRCDVPDACPRRVEAVKAGRFELGETAWRWLDATTPAEEWTTCPWCGRPLPSAAEIRFRVPTALYRQRVADGADLGDDDDDFDEDFDDAA